MAKCLLAPHREIYRTETKRRETQKYRCTELKQPQTLC